MQNHNLNMTAAELDEALIEMATVSLKGVLAALVPRLSWKWRVLPLSLATTERTREQREPQALHPGAEVSILRRHFLEKVSVPTLRGRVPNPSHGFFCCWLKQFFENGATSFQNHRPDPGRRARPGTHCRPGTEAAH